MFELNFGVEALSRWKSVSNFLREGQHGTITSSMFDHHLRYSEVVYSTV